MDAQPEIRQTIADLLIATGSAHGDYENSSLGGEYDTGWAAWYAAYLIAHDIGSLLGTPRTLNVDDLTRSLDAYDMAYYHEQATDPWPLDYARRLLADFSSFDPT